MPGNRTDLLFVATERLKILHHPDIVDFDQLIAGRCCKPVAVLVPLKAQDGILVTMAIHSHLRKGHD
jgi:hypothetical protein